MHLHTIGIYACVGTRMRFLHEYPCIFTAIVCKSRMLGRDCLGIFQNEIYVPELNHEPSHPRRMVMYAYNTSDNAMSVWDNGNISNLDIYMVMLPETRQTHTWIYICIYIYIYIYIQINYPKNELSKIAFHHKYKIAPLVDRCPLSNNCDTKKINHMSTAVEINHLSIDLKINCLLLSI